MLQKSMSCKELDTTWQWNNNKNIGYLESQAFRRSHCAEAWQRGSTPRPKVRGGDRELQAATAQGLPGGANPV